MTAERVRSMALAFLGICAALLICDARFAMSQTPQITSAPAEAEMDINKKIAEFMKLGSGAYPIKEKDGVITHIVLVGRGILNPSLPDPEGNAQLKADVDADSRLAFFIDTKVSAYVGVNSETVVLTEGEGAAPTLQSSKAIEKTNEWKKKQTEAMVRGLQTLQKEVTDKHVTIAKLWTAKTATQARGVADANNPPPPPKPRPAPGTVTPGTVVNPDAEKLLK